MVLLWTDADVDEWIATNYPWFLEVFRGYRHPVQRADAFRYFVLHAYGGVYADLDYELMLPLDSFLPDVNRPLGFVAPGDWSTSISNSLMMSMYCPNLWDPVHRSLVTASETSKKSIWSIFPSSQVMSATGPTFLRMWLEQQKPLYICRLMRQQFSPCDYCQPDCRLRGPVFAVHHYARSWNNMDTLLLNLVVCNWQYLVLITALICAIRSQRHLRSYVSALLTCYRMFCTVEVLYVGIAFVVTFVLVTAMPA